MSAVVFAAGIGTAEAAQAQSQDPLAHIRDLYSNAAYEEVLSTLTLDSTTPPELGQYKVFSLIALGRGGEAEKAAEAVIIANPRFQPDRDASPRVLELFTKVRRSVAPELLKSMYLNAKAAFDRKDRDVAVRSFSEVVAVTEVADLKDDKTVGELHLLASGFLELSRALPSTPPTRAEEPLPSSDGGSTGAGSTAAQAASPRAGSPKIVLPVPIQEVLPRWTPPASFARVEYRGAIVLRIDAQGKVLSSEMQTPTHPVYDAELLRASKSWRYKPATNDGVPIPAERVLAFVLKPRLQ
jgi:TonB family protein